MANKTSLTTSLPRTNNNYNIIFKMMMQRRIFPLKEEEKSLKHIEKLKYNKHLQQASCTSCINNKFIVKIKFNKHVRYGPHGPYYRLSKFLFVIRQTPNFCFLEKRREIWDWKAVVLLVECEKRIEIEAKREVEVLLFVVFYSLVGFVLCLLSLFFLSLFLSCLSLSWCPSALLLSLSLGFFVSSLLGFFFSVVGIAVLPFYVLSVLLLTVFFCDSSAVCSLLSFFSSVALFSSIYSPLSSP